MQFTYEELAQRTANTDYKAVISRFDNNIILKNMFVAFEQQKQLTEKLDAAKKYFYYGKGQELLAIEDRNISTDINIENFKQKIQDHRMVNVIHGLLGMITESGELLEAVLKSVNEDEELDIVNVIEEVGDIFWYAALISNTFNTNFEKIQMTNIKKLKKRYPYGFTDYDAVNRDVDSERKNLEKSLGNI